MRASLIYILLSLATFAFAQEIAPYPDKVIMFDGKEINGKIIEKNETELLLNSENNIPFTINLGYIKKYIQVKEAGDVYVWTNKDFESIKKYTTPSNLVHEVGINMTSLVTQFLPLGRSTTNSGPYNITYRVGNGKNYFNIQGGLKFDRSNFNDLQHANLALGYMRKSEVNNKFNYYTLLDFMITSGNFNEPNTSGDNDNPSAGAGIGFGLEYNLYENIYLGTETILFVGPNLLDFVAPIGLYMIAKFER